MSAQTIDAQTVAATRSPWPVFAVCATAFFIIMFDLAVVNVAFPDILSDFGVSRADGSWIVTLYNILFGSLLVVAGKTADSVGRRRIFQIGVATFGLGAALAAFAPTLAVLLAGRAVQGVGAAFMSPRGSRPPGGSIPIGTPNPDDGAVGRRRGLGRVERAEHRRRHHRGDQLARSILDSGCPLRCAPHDERAGPQRVTDVVGSAPTRLFRCRRCHHQGWPRWCWAFPAQASGAGHTLQRSFRSLSEWSRLSCSSRDSGSTLSPLST